MLHGAWNIWLAMGDTVCALAAAYALCAVPATLSWLRRKPRPGAWRPPVTILKPLCGAEPGLYDSLRSCCEQDYPQFQLVFGVHSASDPAIAIVERLRREYPRLDIQLVVDARLIGANYKVSNLANMLPAARHDVLVIADSDIRAGRDWLAQVAAPLGAADVGLATCLYRARPGRGIWSRLAAMFVNGWFAPSVMLSAAFGWRAFGFGATLALRRAVLGEIGGLTPLADHVADDYMLGQRVRRCGYRTVLAHCMVETALPTTNFAGLIRHELRQARALKTLQLSGYAFTFFTYGIAAAALMLLLTGLQPFALAAVGFVWLAKLVLLAAVAPDRRWLPMDFLLLPLRDLLSLAIWGWSFAGRQIVWRGRRFVLARDGRLTELTALHQAAPPAWRRQWAALYSRLTAAADKK